MLGNEYEFDFVDEARMIKEEYFNLRRLRLLSYFRKTRNSDLLWVHSGTSFLKIFHIVTGKLFHKKVVLTIHAYPHRKNVLLYYLDKVFFNMADRIVVVNSEITSRIKIPERKCAVMNAFLPPVMEDEPGLPLYIEEWISAKRKKGMLIVSSNAYRLETYKGEDLYGLDLCIEAARRLSGESPEFTFIFNVSVLDDFKETYDRYKEIIRESGLKDNFLLTNENLSFVRLMEQSDIVLRPTNTDGDSLTVREAIYLEKTVIASDVVKRPAGTLLFRSRDVEDLADRLIEVVSKKDLMLEQAQPEIIYKTFYTELIDKTLARDQSGVDDLVGICKLESNS